ncbi:MAG: YfiM family protein [Cytophagaceae bacterium]|nr:YfiM family protein [Cytophagaceae bacterium]
MIKLTTFFFLLLLSCKELYSQRDTSFISGEEYSFSKRKTILAGGATGALYVSSMTGLYFLWYKDYPQSRFHFFNDNNEWQQMDKIGHFTTGYYIGKLGIDALKWTGMKRKKAIWIGGISGLIFLTNIEIFDGFSSYWGFSYGDMTANIAGSGLVISQALIWDEQRIKLKFSFLPSPYAKYRPDELGSNLAQNILKDYNGQTYWLSINIFSFLNEESKFPEWLNVALGYGAEGMIGAKENPTQINGNSLPYFKRYRQFYLSVDADLTKIRTKSKFLKTVFSTIGFIKFPAPALEFNSEKKLVFHPIYF